MTGRLSTRSVTTGFTLIELLVVISIISLLSSVLLASLSTSRSKARDAQRISSTKQFINAIELFYNQNGRYPGTNNSGSYGLYGSWSGDGWLPEVSPTYIALVTKDPVNTASPELFYLYRRTDTDYCLQVAFENDCSVRPDYYASWSGSCKIRVGSSHNYCWSF